MSYVILNIVVNCDIVTNVSKHALNKEFEKELFVQFINLFSSSNKKTNAELFSSLFTESERIMFIKRLAVIVLVQKKVSTYKIAQKLHVSDATARAILQKIEGKSLDPILACIQKKSFDADAFWKTVDLILRAGLPPRGRGRWKWLYEMTDDLQKR